MTKDEPLKITLDDLVPEEPTARPQAAGNALQGKVEARGRTLAEAVRDMAGKATDKVTTTAAETTNRTAEAARDKLGEALQEQSQAIVDAIEGRVRDHAHKGAEGGLRWLSDKLSVFADRVKDHAIPDVTPKDPPSPPAK